MRPLTPLRLTYGAALLAAPGLLCRAVGGPTDRPALVVARILGARQLAEGALLARHPARRWVLAGATVDGLHAATMLGLAFVDRGHRRVALANALTASALAAEGAHQALTSR